MCNARARSLLTLLISSSACAPPVLAQLSIRPIWSSGYSETTDLRKLFGRIGQAAISETGSLLVLDAELNRVSIVEKDNELLPVLGSTPEPRVGRLTAIAWTSSLEFVAIDANARALLRMQKISGEWKLTAKRRITISAYRACSLDGSIVLLGRAPVPPTEPSPLLHIIGQDGSTRKAFGDGYGNFGPYAQIGLMFGELLCLPNERIVLVASHAFGQVRAYTSDGDLLWLADVPGFERAIIDEESQTRVSVRFPPRGSYQNIVSLVQLTPTIAAVQVATILERGTDSDARPITHFLRISDGKWVGKETGPTKILSANPKLRTLLVLTGSAELSYCDFTFNR